MFPHCVRFSLKFCALCGEGWKTLHHREHRVTQRNTEDVVFVLGGWNVKNSTTEDTECTEEDHKGKLLGLFTKAQSLFLP
jgi:hypothetical protein